MEQDRLKDWGATSCGSLALAFIAILLVMSGIGWRMFERGSEPENSTNPQQSAAPQQSSSAPTGSAAPTSRDYMPGVEPKYVPKQSAVPTARDIIVARFTVDWNKENGILRLDASNSTYGYKYVWYFGWSADKNTGVTVENPMYVTIVNSQQLDSNLASRDITLNLVDDNGQIVATQKEMLP